MAKGEHLCVDTSYGSFIEHHGIDMGDGTVIHFKKDRLGAVPVIARTSGADFANGRKVVIVPHRSSLPPDNVVAIAEQLLTFQRTGLLKHYDLMKFNCEHFASFCKTGHLISDQVDNTEHAVELGSPFLKVLAAVGLAFLGESFSE